MYLLLYYYNPFSNILFMYKISVHINVYLFFLSITAVILMLAICYRYRINLSHFNGKLLSSRLYNYPYC